MATDVTERFGVAHIIHRESVDQSENVDSRFNQTLKLHAFPIHFPQRFYMIPNFYGIKVASLDEEKSFVSFFYYGGKTDDWNQPVFEAWVVVFDKELYDLLFRDLIAIKDYFKSGRTFSASALKSKLIGYMQNKSATLNDAVFRILQGAAKITDPGFLTEAISTVLVNKRVTFLGGTLDLVEHLFRIITLFMPTKIILSRSISTVCTKPEEENREDIVLTQLSESSTFVKIKEPQINLEKYKIKSGSSLKIIESFVNEVIFGEEWFGFSEREKFLALLKVLNDILDRKFTSIIDSSSRLKLMKKTLDSVSELEKIIQKRKKELEKLL